MSESWNDAFRLRKDHEPEPKTSVHGQHVPGRETSLWVVNIDDYATGFQQPDFSDAWWFLAKEDGCVEFGQLRDGEWRGGEHACNIDQLISLLRAVRDYMRAKDAGWGRE